MSDISYQIRRRKANNTVLLICDYISSIKNEKNLTSLICWFWFVPFLWSSLTFRKFAFQLIFICCYGYCTKLIVQKYDLQIWGKKSQWHKLFLINCACSSEENSVFIRIKLCILQSLNNGLRPILRTIGRYDIVLKWHT